MYKLLFQEDTWKILLLVSWLWCSFTCLLHGYSHWKEKQVGFVFMDFSAWYNKVSCFGHLMIDIWQFNELISDCWKYSSSEIVSVAAFSLNLESYSEKNTLRTFSFTFVSFNVQLHCSGLSDKAWLLRAFSWNCGFVHVCFLINNLSN